MAKRLIRIAPWQAGKVFAVIYFCISLLVVIPMAVVTALSPPVKGMPGPGFLVIIPFAYALFGLVFVPLCCWIYNLSARFTGGIEVGVTDVADA
jgi:hypothetical protein